MDVAAACETDLIAHSCHMYADCLSVSRRWQATRGQPAIRRRERCNLVLRVWFRGEAKKDPQVPVRASNDARDSAASGALSTRLHRRRGCAATPPTTAAAPNTLPTSQQPGVRPSGRLLHRVASKPKYLTGCLGPHTCQLRPGHLTAPLSSMHPLDLLAPKVRRRRRFGLCRRDTLHVACL